MGVVDKFLNLIGFEEVEGPEAPMEDVGPDATTRRRRGSLVSLPGPRTMRMVVAEPKGFEEAQAMTDHLKQKRPVIVNLESMDKDAAQRFIHFLSGAIYALDGSMQRVGSGIFLFVPSNVEVTLREREDVRERGGLMRS